MSARRVGAPRASLSSPRRLRSAKPSPGDSGDLHATHSAADKSGLSWETGTDGVQRIYVMVDSHLVGEVRYGRWDVGGAGNGQRRVVTAQTLRDWLSPLQLPSCYSTSFTKYSN